jgi:sugar lactone lactonase YvrE
MVIRIAADFRRRAGIAVCLLLGILTLCTVAGAQAPPVTAGSIVTIPASNTWGQIYKILFFQGNTLALDSANDELYQLSPGATSWTTVVGKGGILGSGFNAQGIAMDAMGTLYITISYTSKSDSNALFWRVPFSNGTWSVTASDGWGDNIMDPNTGNAVISEVQGALTQEAFFQNSPAMDGTGTLFFQMTTTGNIWSVPVDASGDTSSTDEANGVNATEIVSGLTAGEGKIAVDANGNIYFVEYHGVKNTARDTGIWFIPAGQNGLVGVGSPIVRIDAGQANSSSPIVYAGVTLDANGDLWLTSENNSNYDETVAGSWEIPNTCGPTGVTASNVTKCLNWNNISMVTPVDGNQPLSIDSRGYLWIPSYQNSFPPNTSNAPYPGPGGGPGIYAVLVWAPGVLNLNLTPSGPTPTGAQGSAGILYYTFNSAFTPGGFQFSSAPGTVSPFGTTQTNPLPPSSSTTTPPSPCNTVQAAGGYASFTAQSWCELWVTLDPTVPGPVSGELTVLDSNNNPIAGSAVYLNGTGQGAGVSMLNSPQLNTLAAGLKTPAQVASDALGDTWVADPGNKEVLYFPAGSIGASGTSIGAGFTDPTGVAVDGSGDVYIADKGKVYEIPCVVSASSPNGCAAGTQTTVASGLGSNLNLAVDGSGNVYVADPQNQRVVKIPTPGQSELITYNNEIGSAGSTVITVGSGFTAPSAVAVDTFGDVFVADSGNLYEVTVPPQSQQIEQVVGTLNDVTGLAVDASGSVIVSQSGGLYRVPAISGVLTANSAGPLDISVDVPSTSTTEITTTSITSPNGISVDQTGNLYVTDMTNGPNLYQLNVNGFVNFGVGLAPLSLDELNVPLVNIGNMNLTVTAAEPPISFSGGTATEDAYFSIPNSSGGSSCDPTGATPVAPGDSCNLGTGFTPPAGAGSGSVLYSGFSMSVPTNAVNIAGGTVSANLQGTALAGLEVTQTAVQVNLTSPNFPGSGSVVVTVAPECNYNGNNICYASNIPSGSVTLTLTCASTGCTQAPIVQTEQATGDDTGTTATFNVANLPGGSYLATAAYAGNVSQLFQKSSGSQSFSVGTSAPVITLSEPSGVTPNATNGVYYVLYQGASTITANVSSPLGTPSGTVTIMNGNQVLGTATYGQGQNWTFPLGSLPQGSYSVTAVYSGDQNFSTIPSSPAVTFQVIPPSVLLTANPTTISTPAGTPVTTTITIQSLVGFSATTGANVTCEVTPQDTVPYYAECTFSNPQPEICAPTGLPGDTCTPATTVLTLSSNIPVNIPTTSSNVPMDRSHLSPLLPAGIFGLGMLGLALRRRRIVNRYLLNLMCLMLFLAGTVIGLTSCTNSSYSHPPPVPHYKTTPGNYNMSIVVTDPITGALESQPFTLGVTIQ